MSHTEAAMNNGTREHRYRDFDRMLQHQQQTFFFHKFIFLYRLECCLLQGIYFSKIDQVILMLSHVKDVCLYGYRDN